MLDAPATTTIITASYYTHQDSKYPKMEIKSSLDVQFLDHGPCLVGIKNYMRYLEHIRNETIKSSLMSITNGKV